MSTISTPSRRAERPIGNSPPLPLTGAERTVKAPSTKGLMHYRVLYRLTRLALVLPPGHHLDDLLGQDAVGWGLTSEVNAFTASLVVYPVIAAGPEAAGNLFRREGEYWTISYEGSVVR